MTGTKPDKKPRSWSMRSLILTLMVGLIVSMAVVFVAITLVSGFIPSMNDVAFRTLSSHADGGASRVSSELNVLSRAARQSATDLQNIYQADPDARDILLEGRAGTTAEIDALIAPAYRSVTSLLESVSATGAFVMLETTYTQGDNKAAIYMRDPTPGTGGSPDMDLTVLRGHVRNMPDRTPALDNNWSYEQEPLDGSLGDFFEKPLAAVVEYPRADLRDLGYWSQPFRVSPNDKDIVTFTTPLVSGSMQPYGVLGLEFTVRYLQQIMPQENLPFEDGFYLIGQMRDGGIDVATAFSTSSDGALFLMGYDDVAPLEDAHNSSGVHVYRAKSRDIDMFVAAASLNLYGRSSPFGGEEYYLFTIAPRAQVLQNSRTITYGLAVALGFSIIVAAIASLFLSRFFARRIEKLAGEVRSVDPEHALALSGTNITEINALSDVIEQMSRTISQHYARMSTIVDLVGMQMGAFEIHTLDNTVYMTESLFTLLGIAHGEEDSHYVNGAFFSSLFPGLTLPEREREPVETNIEWPRDEGENRWFRARMVRMGNHVYGTIVDITEEIKQRKWLEYERDYDPLTRLLNRNAYPERMNALIRNAPDEMGALLFGDLDNLKYINDTFGHDMGDRYIQMAANALKRFEARGGVVARISGDEFATYLHGFDSREAIRAIVDEEMIAIRDTQMQLPDGSMQKVRISVGVAYYPDDAQTIDMLIKYADFAMYEIKHSVKGLTGEFDAGSYGRNSFIVRKTNFLDLMIEQRRIRFAFQPIIDVRTGDVMGYEALMRPQMREIHTPMEAIALAKSQSKLYQIEGLTADIALDWLTESADQLQGKRLFINLIANQALVNAQYVRMRALFTPEDNPLVMEITEGEQRNETLMAKKLATLREAGCKIALDDYGTGYNSELSLLSIAPDYVKVDMSLVRNIDKDPNRQKILMQLVSYAHTNHIRVIAEGVETSIELDAVVRLGTDYVQGYYTGYPEYDLGLHSRKAADEAAALRRKYWGE